MARSPTPRGPGEYLGRAMLGTEAVYRVVAPIGEDLVEVEVISAPGLEAGTRLRLTHAAVERMTVVQRPRGSRRSGTLTRERANPPSPRQRPAEPTGSCD